MPVTNEYIPGVPSWFELATTDQDGAKKFYSTVFDWTPTDRPFAQGQVYTEFSLGGAIVGGCCSLVEALRAQGVPPHWAVYFATADADATVKKAEELGGKILQPVFDVMGHGRMAVIQDPGGAAFSIWQNIDHDANRLTGDVGSVCWVELMTRSLEKVRAFYEGLFGWELKPFGEGMQYFVFEVANHGHGGIMPMDDTVAGVPSYWGIYLTVEHCDHTVAEIKQLGGKLLAGPMDYPNVGRFAIVADAQGAAFGVLQPPAGRA